MALWAHVELVMTMEPVAFPASYAATMVTGTVRPVDGNPACNVGSSVRCPSYGLGAEFGGLRLCGALKRSDHSAPPRPL